MANEFPEATARPLLRRGDKTFTLQEVVEMARSAIESHCDSELKTKAGWLLVCCGELQTELQGLRTAAQEAVDFIEAIGRDIHYVYSPEAAETVSRAADSALAQLRAALHPQQEQER